MTLARSVSVFAPGSIGNVGPGLDILGLAVTGAGDNVTATGTAEPGIRIDDPGHPELSSDPTRHAAALAAAAVLRLAGSDASGGIALRVHKGLPLSGGQGGSAASGVAGAVAVNELLDRPLTQHQLLGAALEAEEFVAGRHLDNIAPSLLGGCVLVRSLDPIDVVQLPVPGELRIVLAHPSQRMRTADARSILPLEVSRAVAIHQAAQVAAIVAALESGDLPLLGRAIDDRIAEPVRGPLLPGFAEAKRSALEAGALGCSISGSGPTIFALVADHHRGEVVADAMAAAYRRLHIEARVWVADVDREGARLT